MHPQEYDQWYQSPKGKWIGENEYALCKKMLSASAGSSVLDVGCGTGYFSRKFSADGLQVTAVDLSRENISFAKHKSHSEQYAVADMTALPFADQAFDYVVAITSLCFVDREEKAIREMMRVARHRVLLGLLNRRSILYWQKGRKAASGSSYFGAHWHSASDLRTMLHTLPAMNLNISSAILHPDDSMASRYLEKQIGNKTPFGSFLAVAFDL